jgi:transcriptional regulator GlxA family with amidase domain
MDLTKQTSEAGTALPSDWSDPRVIVIVEVFRQHLARRVTVDELSAIVGLSASGLPRLFKQQMGCSIGRWQKDERLRAARFLLCTTCLSVKEINAAVGNQDLSHFVRDFERAFGLSPTRFRRMKFDASALLRTDKPTDC